MKKKVFIISFICILIDQLIKVLIDNCLNKSINIINNFFSITKVYNEGISFSLLSGRSYLIIILTIIILLFLINYMKHFKNNKKNIISFSLIFGGLFGNLIDRIIYNHVIDYLDFNIFGYNFPIFNFADMCIVIGVGLLTIAIIKGEDNEISSR